MEVKGKVQLTEQQINNMKQTQRVLDNEGVYSKENLGKLIMNDLIKEYKKNNSFTVGDDSESGLNTLAAGGVSLIMLISKMNYDIDEDIEIKEILDKVIKDTINYIENNGYDFTPFIPYEKTKNIFNRRISGTEQFEYYSIEALTWVLSFFIQVRRAYLDHKIDLEEEISKKIIRWIGRCLKYVEDAASYVSWIEKEDGNEQEVRNTAAWGFLNKSTDASIYYTGIVMESLSEFDDNIIVSDVNLQNTTKPDIELLEYLGSNRVQKGNRIYLKDIPVNEEDEEDEIPEYGVATRIFSRENDLTDEEEGLMQRTSKWVWYTFSEDIKNNTLKFDENYKNDKIFAMIYLLELITITYTEEFIDRKSVEETIEAGIFFVDRRIKKLEEDNVKFVQISTYKSEFDGLAEENEIDSKLNRILNKRILIGPNLRPLRIKLGGLNAFFFTRYPDKRMASELEAILKDRNKNRFLWDISEYNIFYTEKAIESLVDFFNYYENFEKKYVELYEESDKIRHELEQKLEKRIRKEVEKSIKTELDKEHKKEIDTLEKRIEDKEHELMNGKLIIYSQLKEFVNQCFDERLEKEIDKEKSEFIDELNKVLMMVDKYNRNRVNAESENIKILSETFQKAVTSQIYLESKQDTEELKAVMNEYERNRQIIMDQFFDYLLANEDERKILEVVKTLQEKGIL